LRHGGLGLAVQAQPEAITSTRRPSAGHQGVFVAHHGLAGQAPGRRDVGGLGVLDLLGRDLAGLQWQISAILLSAWLNPKFAFLVAKMSWYAGPRNSSSWSMSFSAHWGR
jgi:hypothetical protein